MLGTILFLKISTISLGKQRRGGERGEERRCYEIKFS